MLNDIYILVNLYNILIAEVVNIKKIKKYLNVKNVVRIVWNTTEIGKHQV